MNARRIATWVIGTILVSCAAVIVWSIVYAAVTGFAFKTWALLSVLTRQDPTISFKHAAYYWASIAVKKNIAIAAGITAALFVAGYITIFVMKGPSLYGDARFARGGDLLRANLHAREGLILGWHGSSLLRNDDPRHPLVTGPTRSGKGRGFVIPNLLAWGGSTITLDLKQENFKETAGARRAAGDEVFMFAPGSARSHCYNPLDFVRRGPEKITDLTNVAHFLIPDPKSGETIWSQKARDLFVGVLGYVLESTHIAKPDRTIRTAIRVLSTGRDVGAVLAAIVKVEGDSLSPFVVGRFNQIIAEPVDTRGSVLANLTTALAPWDNPLIAGVTSKSDFDIRLLRRKRMSIYIGPPPSDLESYRSLIRLLVQQMHDALMRELPGPDDKFDVLVMLDEFRQLQRMDAIVEKIPISAGYGFRMAIIIQNMSQLDEIYGKASREGIVANCALKLFVSVDDLATANYVSDQLGQRTVETSTVNLRRGGSMFGERSVSKGLTGVPLMRPDEVIRLPKDRSILMIANERPILTTKIRYDKDRMFQKLAASGRSAFRNVPDVPMLDEQPLSIVSKAYGGNSASDNRKPTKRPGTVISDSGRIPEAVERKPAEPKHTTFVDVHEAVDPTDPMDEASMPAVATREVDRPTPRTRKSSSKASRPRKRPADPIMATVAAVSQPAPVTEIRSVRKASIELNAIADMVSEKGRASKHVDEDDIADLVADIRHTVRASQLSDQGDLLEDL